MYYMIKIIRKWRSHKTTPCKGHWLYRAVSDEWITTDWMTWAEYQAWKNTIIIEDF